MFYPKVCIIQLLKVTWYRVIALFTLHFLFDDTSITILALPCNRGFSLSDQGYLKLSKHYKSTGYNGDLRKFSLGSYIRHIILNHAKDVALCWIRYSFLINFISTRCKTFSTSSIRVFQYCALDNLQVSNPSKRNVLTNSVMIDQYVKTNQYLLINESIDSCKFKISQRSISNI
jgi:hypothetical protein